MRKPLPLRLLKSDTKQISNSMASATAPPAPFTFLTRNQTNNEHRTDTRWLTTKQRRRRVGLQVYAKEEGATGRQRAPPGVDTRIHWENEDEGWVGESKSRSTQERIKTDEKNLFDEKFSDLLNSSANSHYQLVFIIYFAIFILSLNVWLTVHNSNVSNSGSWEYLQQLI